MSQLSLLNTKFLALPKEQMSQKSKFSIEPFFKNRIFKIFTLLGKVRDKGLNHQIKPLKVSKCQITTKNFLFHSLHRGFKEEN